MTYLRFAPAALVLTLAACGTPPPIDNEAAANQTANDVVTSAGAAEPGTATPAVRNTRSPAATQTAERYLGHWVGVEGMVLDVTGNPAGGVRLAMQYDLDHKGTYDGTIETAGVRFTRNGEKLIAKPSSGEATGLKWLAGKKNCLTVKPGEGYCRD